MRRSCSRCMRKGIYRQITTRRHPLEFIVSAVYIRHFYTKVYNQGVEASIMAITEFVKES